MCRTALQTECENRSEHGIRTLNNLYVHGVVWSALANAKITLDKIYIWQFPEDEMRANVVLAFNRCRAVCIRCRYFRVIADFGAATCAAVVVVESAGGGTRMSFRRRRRFNWKAIPTWQREKKPNNMQIIINYLYVNVTVWRIATTKAIIASLL